MRKTLIAVVLSLVMAAVSGLATFYLYGLYKGGAASSLSEQTPGPLVTAQPASYEGGAGTVTFADITAQAGIDFRHHQAEETIDALPQVMGSGVCLFDYDGDGNIDIFLVNGSGFTYYYGAKPWWYKPPTNVLYRNNGNGTFTDVSRKAGLEKSGWGMGCTAGDFNNDGRPDLYVTNYGRNVLYKNNGDGTFTDVTDIAGVGGVKEKWSTSAAWADYDNDGRLDLYVVNYIKYDKVMNPAELNSSFKTAGDLMMNSKIYTSAPNILYHNNGDGTFTDVTNKAGVADSAGKGLGVVFSDFDNDGRQDIYVVNEGLRNVLFLNNGNGTFTDVGGETKTDSPSSGMGVAVGDYDNDGAMDIFSTYPGYETNLLHRNLPGKRPLFRDVTMEAGLGEEVSVGYFGWGTGFFDYDNDGLLDLFVANGDPSPDFDNPRATVGQRSQLFRNTGGSFTDVSRQAGSGLKPPRPARGAAFGDLDNDGDIDIVINNNNDYTALLRNDGGNRQNWLTIKLQGTKSNRDGIGARVVVSSGELEQANEVRSGSSYLSQSDIRLHFGLGRRELAETVSVRWPSGLSQVFRDIKANQFVTIVEGQDTVKAVPVRKRPSSAVVVDSKAGEGKAIAALEDRDAGVRKEAASLLCGLLKDEQTIMRATMYSRREAVVPLLKALGDADAAVRAEVVKALGYSESYRAVVPVTGALNDADRGIRREAAVALGRLKDRRGIEPLMETLRKSDEAADVRSAALLSLAGLGSDGAATLVEQAKAEDEKARLGAVETLRAVLGEPETVVLKRQEILATLNGALKDPSPKVRRRSVEAMSAFKEPTAAQGLIDALKDSSVDVRKAAVIGLGQLRDARATEQLVNIVKGGDEALKHEALRALSRLSDKRAADGLLHVIMDGREKADVRLASIAALKNVDPGRWVANAAKLMADSTPEVRCEAIKGVALSKDANAVDALVGGLSDAVASVRKDAAAALASFKGKRVVDQLIVVAKRGAEDKEVRRAAINSLAAIGDERAVLHLQGIAGNGRDELRMEAVNALRKFGHQQ